MYILPLKATNTQQPDTGKLRLSVISALRNQPVEDATVTISYSGDPNSIIETAKTDANGQIPELTLPAPPLEYSMAPSEYQPYSEYTFRISKEGFEDLDISGSEILPETTSIQRAVMNPAQPQNNFEDIVIPAHTLYGDYPEKIPEDEIKPMDTSGEIVLSRVVIPEYVVVHDGAPTNPTAQNYYVRYRDYIKNVASSEIYATWPVLSRVVIPEYVVVHDGAPTNPTAQNYYVRYRDYIKNVASSEIYATWPDSTIRANVLAIMSFTGAPTNPTAQNYYVRYRDYIKNVASSEIYATWPDSTIRANVLAIMSFTLNRVYTEFYRNKGYDFTITSSTAFDHKWIHGRNIFESISRIVDEVFHNYLSRPGVRQPILTQYCDGQRVTCPGWMTLKVFLEL